MSIRAVAELIRAPLRGARSVSLRQSPRALALATTIGLVPAQRARRQVRTGDGRSDVHDSQRGKRSTAVSGQWIARSTNEQLVEDQRVGLSPRLQKTISTMIFRSSRFTGPPGIAVARSSTISRIAGGSTPADFEEADEADAGFAQMLLLGGGIHAHAARRLLGDTPCWAVLDRPSSQVSASSISSDSKPTAVSLRAS